MGNLTCGILHLKFGNSDFLLSSVAKTYPSSSSAFHYLIHFLAVEVANPCAPLVQTINRVEIESLAGPNYVTTNGKEITADAHFVCIGKRVGSSWLRDTELSDLVDADGRLKVDSNLRLEGKPNIFAIGDVCNTKVCRRVPYKLLRTQNNLVCLSDPQYPSQTTLICERFWQL